MGYPNFDTLQLFALGWVSIPWNVPLWLSVICWFSKIQIKKKKKFIMRPRPTKETDIQGHRNNWQWPKTKLFDPKSIGM